MANLQAKRPDYDGPDVATRWRERPEGAGKPNREWIRKRLNRHGKDGTDADTELEQIIDHQIEVAKSWEVRVIGRDGDGELLKVASARESVEAAKLLLAYAKGKPPADDDEWLLKLAEHMRSVARDQIEIARSIKAKQLETMTDAEVAAFLQACNQDTRRFLVAAAITISGQQQPEQISAPPTAEQTTAPQTESGSVSGGSHAQTATEVAEARNATPEGSKDE